jgi:hypothetical protein
MCAGRTEGQGAGRREKGRRGEKLARTPGSEETCKDEGMSSTLNSRRDPTLVWAPVIVIKAVLFGGDPSIPKVSMTDEPGVHPSLDTCAM